METIDLNTLNGNEQRHFFAVRMRNHCRIDDCHEQWFFQVLGNIDLLKYITSFQKGKKWNEIISADWVAKNNYYSLLKEKPNLIYTYRSAMHAVNTGNVCMVQWIYTNKPQYCKNLFAPEIAASLGYFDLLRWLHEHSTVKFDSTIIDQALSNGHLSIAEWLYYDLGIKPSSRAIDMAASHGNMEAMKWIYEREPLDNFLTDFPSSSPYIEDPSYEIDYIFPKRCVYYATSSGNLPMLQWLFSVHAKGFTCEMMDVATRNKDLKVVKWFLENKVMECTTIRLDNAVYSRSIEVLDYLYNQSSENYSTEAMLKACLLGDLPIAQYLESKGVLFNSECFSATCMFDHMIRWAYPRYRELFRPLHMKIVTYASLSQTVQWLHSQGESCSQDLIGMALLNGDLTLIQWFYEIGLRDDSRSMMNDAVRYGHLHILQWLYNNEKDWCTTESIDTTIMNGNYNVMEFLMQHELCNPGDYLKKAIEHRKVDIYLLLCKYTSTKETEFLFLTACAFSCHEVVKLTYPSGNYSLLNIGMKLAAQAIRQDALTLDVVKWLYEKTPTIYTKETLVRILKCQVQDVLHWACTQTNIVNVVKDDLKTIENGLLSKYVKLWFKENVMDVYKQ